MGRKRKLSGVHILVAIWAASTLAACLPLPRSDPGITDEQLAPIEIGKTTHTEVEEILGEPSIIWESERVWVYEQGPSGSFLWIIPGVYQAGVFLTELGDDVLIMRFDQEGMVERLSRQVGPLDRRNYGDFLRNWLADESGKVDSNRQTP